MRGPRISGSYIDVQYSYLNNFETQIAGAYNEHAYKGLTYTKNTVSLIIFGEYEKITYRC